MKNQHYDEATTTQVHRLEHVGFEKHQVNTLIEIIGEQIHTAVSAALVSLATKEALEKCATRDDLKRYATKEDLERFATKEDLERFATKEDLEKCATKEGIEKLVTKDDFHKAITQVLIWTPTVVFGAVMSTAVIVTTIIKLMD